MNENCEARIEATKAHEMGLITHEELKKELTRLDLMFDVLNAESKPFEEQLCLVDHDDLVLDYAPHLVRNNQLN